jgi:tRNA dimethylallyltransferase
MSETLIAVVGPTASGKSDLGIYLAQKFSGEIINCDSVQIYKEIEIATAKVPLSERHGIPHHLIDYITPFVNYTAADWAKDAREKIGEIRSRGNLPILVGGTGFYLKALIEPLFESPSTDPKLRERLTHIRKRKGPLYLYRLLQRLDKAASLKLFPRDWARVQRAVEIRVQTGRSILSYQRETTEESREFKVYGIGLNPDRDKLYSVINRRTEVHFNQGLVEEVRSLIEKGIPVDSNALGAHGYRRVVEYLRGERPIESAIEQTKLDVRHYAKRQRTWFKREDFIKWFNGFGTDPLIQIEAGEYLTEALSNIKENY